MLSVKIEGFTNVLVQPSGWDEEREGKCDELAVRVEHIGGLVTFTRTFTSAWEPTPEEIARIVAGGKVEVTAWGGQPPIALSVGDPP